MPDLRFSIVIPTRDRPRTLEFAIRTCLAQQFDDYEIVVGDNCGSPVVREVVERFGSPRIKYVRSDTPLASVVNVRSGASHAGGVATRGTRRRVGRGSGSAATRRAVA